MACSLKTRAEILEVVVETINANANNPVSGEHSSLSAFDDQAKRFLYFPVRDAIEARGCSTDGLYPETTAKAKKVSDIVDIIMKANGGT